MFIGVALCFACDGCEGLDLWFWGGCERWRRKGVAVSGISMVDCGLLICLRVRDQMDLVLRFGYMYWRMDAAGKERDG